MCLRVGVECTMTELSSTVSRPSSQNSPLSAAVHVSVNNGPTNTITATTTTDNFHNTSASTARHVSPRAHKRSLSSSIGDSTHLSIITGRDPRSLLGSSTVGEGTHIHSSLCVCMRACVDAYAAHMCDDDACVQIRSISSMVRRNRRPPFPTCSTLIT